METWRKRPARLQPPNHSHYQHEAQRVFLPYHWAFSSLQYHPGQHMVSRPWWAFTHVSSKYTTDAAQFYFYAFAWGNLAAVVWALAVHRCSACSHAFYIEIPSLSKLAIIMCIHQWRHLLTSPQIEGCPMWDIPCLCRIHVLFYELPLHWSHRRVSVPCSCCNASLMCTKHHGFWIHFLFGTVWTLTLRLGSMIEHCPEG